jgi:LysR family glycine cleavage system transcriptional activator
LDFSDKRSYLHPDSEVRVAASSKLVNFKRDRIDVALRHGLGLYPGCRPSG